MDYKNGKIYKITNNVNDLIYVGSTIQSLSQRYASHKSQSKTITNKKLHKAFTEIGINNFKIELIENYPCNNKEELWNREKYWMKILNTIQNGYNKLSSLLTKEERQQWGKEYRQKIEIKSKNIMNQEKIL